MYSEDKTNKQTYKWINKCWQKYELFMTIQNVSRCCVYLNKKIVENKYIQIKHKITQVLNKVKFDLCSSWFGGAETLVWAENDKFIQVCKSLLLLNNVTVFWDNSSTPTIYYYDILYNAH